MAGRTLDRRKARIDADQATQVATLDQTAKLAASAPKKKIMVKASLALKVKKARAKKPPPRLWARWGVFDGALKQLAVFDYSQRAAAEEKVVQLAVKSEGAHFLQIVKEPMPESVLIIGHAAD
ncbi:MAG: hypothetical protein ACJ8FY_18400 [Gemmataceae bacterium]